MYVRNWIITTWSLPFGGKPDMASHSCNFVVFKKEICPETKKEHWHVYCEFTKKISINQLKLFLNDKTAHCEPRRGTQQQAIDYVIKQETKAGEPLYFGEKKVQGKRSDIDAICDDLLEGDTLKEILYNHGGNALRMMHAIEKSAQVIWGLNETDKYILKMREIKEEKGRVKNIISEAKDIFMT